MIVRICLAAMFAVSSATALGGVVSLSGQIQPIAPPFSVQQGATRNNSAGGLFIERQNFVLPSPLSLNASTSGVFNEIADLTPSTVPQGTRINSYFIHLDRDQLGPLSGTVVFGEAIIGAIFLQPELQASHPIVGHIGVAYPANGSTDALAARMELGFGDEVQIDKLQNQVRFYSESTFFNSDAYDHIRIITSASVPEPTTMALLGCGLASIVVRRKSRENSDR